MHVKKEHETKSKLFREALLKGFKSNNSKPDPFTFTVHFLTFERRALNTGSTAVDVKRSSSSTIIDVQSLWTENCYE